MANPILRDNGYELDDCIARDKYKAVYKCRHTKTGQLYAIKKIRWMGEEKNYTKIKRELEIWQPLSHPNIVQLKQFFESPYHNKMADYYQVMELCVCDLSDWFMNNNARPFKTCVQMIAEIINGLYYLHSKNIIHRDLKPENIFIDGNNVCKIADFDATVNHIKTEVNAHTGNIGNRLYGAPEQFTEDADLKGAYNLKADIYSLGIILMEFFTIFDDLDERTREIKNMRKSAQLPQKFFGNFDKNTLFYREIIKLILLMTRKDPKERPNIVSIKEILVKNLNFS